MANGILLTAVFLSCMFASAALLRTVFQGRIRVQNRLQSFLAAGTEDRALENALAALDEEKAHKSLRDRILLPVWERCRSFMLGRMSHQKTTALEKKLADAGTPFGMTAVDYHIIQLLLAGAFFLLIFLPFYHAAENRVQLLLLALTAACFGGFYPKYYLAAKKKQRIHQIQKMMPDFFDMVNVSIEAGMGLDAAIAKVCRKMEGPLSVEFLQSIDEMKLGKSRKEAFTDLRARIPSEHFQSVMSALIQADQLGIGMAKVLRAQTHRIREQRRQAAKEQAMKAPVKMMIPMVIFMFPTLFIILLGPLVVQLVTKWL